MNKTALLVGAAAVAIGVVGVARLRSDHPEMARRLQGSTSATSLGDSARLAITNKGSLSWYGLLDNVVTELAEHASNVLISPAEAYTPEGIYASGPLLIGGCMQATGTLSATVTNSPCGAATVTITVGPYMTANGTLTGSIVTTGTIGLGPLISLSSLTVSGSIIDGGIANTILGVNSGGTIFAPALSGLSYGSGTLTATGNVPYLFTGASFSTGSANAQTVASVLPGSYSLTTGVTVLFATGNFTNTGAATLNVDASGDVPVTKSTPFGPSVPLTGGELLPYNLYAAWYDGGAYILLSGLPVNYASGSGISISGNYPYQTITATGTVVGGQTTIIAGTNLAGGTIKTTGTISLATAISLKSGTFTGSIVNGGVLAQIPYDNATGTMGTLALDSSHTLSGGTLGLSQVITTGTAIANTVKATSQIIDQGLANTILAANAGGTIFAPALQGLTYGSGTLTAAGAGAATTVLSTPPIGVTQSGSIATVGLQAGYLGPGLSLTGAGTLQGNYQAGNNISISNGTISASSTIGGGISTLVAVAPNLAGGTITSASGTISLGTVISVQGVTATGSIVDTGLASTIMAVNAGGTVIAPALQGLTYANNTLTAVGSGAITGIIGTAPLGFSESGGTATGSLTAANIGPGVSLNGGGSLVGNYAAGAGVSINATDTISNSGVITISGSNLGDNAGTISISPSISVNNVTATGQLVAGAVTGTLAGLNSGGTVIAQPIGNGLAYSSGTLVATGSVVGGSTTIIAGKGLQGGTISTTGTITNAQSIVALNGISLVGSIGPGGYSIGLQPSVTVTGNVQASILNATGSLEIGGNVVSSISSAANNVTINAGVIGLPAAISLAGVTATSSIVDGGVASTILAANSGGTIVAPALYGLTYGSGTLSATGSVGASYATAPVTVTAGSVGVIVGTIGAVLQEPQNQNTYTANQSDTITTIASSASITPDFHTSNMFYTNMTVAASIANPSSINAGSCEIWFINHGAANTTVTGWGSAYQGQGVPGTTGGSGSIVLSSLNGAFDALDVCALNSSTIIVVPGLNFSH